MSQRRRLILTIRVSGEEQDTLERFAAAERLALGTALRRAGLLAASEVLTGREVSVEPTSLYRRKGALRTLANRPPGTPLLARIRNGGDAGACVGEQHVQYCTYVPGPSLSFGDTPRHTERGQTRGPDRESPQHGEPVLACAPAVRRGRPQVGEVAP